MEAGMAAAFKAKVCDKGRCGAVSHSAPSKANSNLFQAELLFKN